MLDLMRANVCRCLGGDPALQLQAGLSKSPAMDVRFLLQQARQAAEAAVAATQAAATAASDGAHVPAASAAEGRMGIIERVQFTKLTSESVEASLRARAAELRFWVELRAPAPDASALHAHAEAMSRAIARATRAFERLLAMAPANVDVLRTFAVFELEVRRNTDAAHAHFDAADAVDEQRSSARRSAAKAARASTTAAWCQAHGVASGSGRLDGGDGGDSGGDGRAQPPQVGAPPPAGGATGHEFKRVAVAVLATARLSSHAAGSGAVVGGPLVRATSAASIRSAGSWRSDAAEDADGADDDAGMGGGTTTMHRKHRRTKLAASSYAAAAAHVRRLSLTSLGDTAAASAGAAPLAAHHNPRATRRASVGALPAAAGGGAATTKPARSRRYSDGMQPQSHVRERMQP